MENAPSCSPRIKLRFYSKAAAIPDAELAANVAGQGPIMDPNDNGRNVDNRPPLTLEAMWNPTRTCTPFFDKIDGASWPLRKE